MSKGKRRAKEEASKRAKKLDMVKDIHAGKKQSSYAAKRARKNPTPSSPFFFDPNNPSHETVEQARERRAREPRSHVAPHWQNDDPR